MILFSGRTEYSDRKVIIPGAGARAILAQPAPSARRGQKIGSLNSLKWYRRDDPGPVSKLQIPRRSVPPPKVHGASRR